MARWKVHCRLPISDNWTFYASSQLNFTGKKAKLRFVPPFGWLRVNVHGSSMAHWKACGRLPINAKWTLTVEALWADIGRNHGDMQCQVQKSWEEMFKNLVFFVHQILGEGRPNFLGGICKSTYFRPTGQVRLRSHGWSFIYADKIKKYSGHNSYIPWHIYRNTCQHVPAFCIILNVVNMWEVLVSLYWVELYFIMLVVWDCCSDWCNCVYRFTMLDVVMASQFSCVVQRRDEWWHMAVESTLIHN